MRHRQWAMLRSNSSSEDIKTWLVRQPNMEMLYIRYNALMADPEPFCRRVMEFVHMPLDLERMLTVPRKDLYRNRATGG